MSTKAALEPTILVIFGVTGNLVRRKLFPALINLIEADLLHEDTVIIGITRQDITTHKLFAELVADNPNSDLKSIKLLQDRFFVHSMDMDNDDDYDKLLNKLDEIENHHSMCMNRLYYLAIPPKVYRPIIKLLGDHGLSKSCRHGTAKTRLLVEKPFGFDLRSARELIEETGKYFTEEQIFRIDHYLAKETVQNILSFRFSNAIFESIWNSNHISRIDISAIEQIGIEDRAAFYEQIGALRDFIQSHLLQLLSIIAMEQPTTMSSNDIHQARIRLLKSVKAPLDTEVDAMAYRGQYETYKTEVNNPTSQVETFAATQVFIDSERWRDVPIIIKTGKSLGEKKTEIKIIFKHVDSIDTSHNSLTFRIQPNEGIDLELYVKKPGLDDEVKIVNMDFSYSRFFDSNSQPDAYERVLVDAARGDHTLFATSEEVLEAWRIVEPVISNWQKNANSLHIYKNNSDNPPEIPAWALPDYTITP